MEIRFLLFCSFQKFRDKVALRPRVHTTPVCGILRVEQRVAIVVFLPRRSEGTRENAGVI